LALTEAVFGHPSYDQMERLVKSNEIIAEAINPTGYTALEKVIAQAYISGRTGNVWKRKVWKTDTNSTDACPALDSYGDGVATPFTDEVAGNDPYMDNYEVFKWQYCNYERESDGTARLTALEGYPDYKEEGSVDVGCIHPTFWWNWVEESDHWILYFSDSPNAELGLVPWKDAVKEDGTVMPYFIVSAFPSVTASDGKLRSQPGRPVNNASYNNINTAYATKGAGYHGSGSSINTLALIYLMVKYQTKLEATVFTGNISFAINAPIARAESNVKRVLVSATESRFQKGSGVTVGTANNAYWLNGSLVSWAEIESVEDVTIDGTQYRALNLKVSSAFTTTTEMFVVGSACPSGQTRKVMGHYDGSIISNTDSKHSFRIEGMEMMNGLWFVQADTVIEFLNNTWNVYVAPKGVAHPQNAHTGFKLIGNSSAFTADAYVGNVCFDLATGGYYHSEKGSGSGVGTGAYHWHGGASVADGTLREWLGWGALGSGASGGLVACAGWSGLGDSGVDIGSRD
jgi:hypothetical protein